MANKPGLCASCDRCRSRKTKCDGNFPCSNCVNKYMKKHRLTSVAGINPDLFECHFSQAKRRGPVPGKSSNSFKKTDEMKRSADDMNMSQYGMHGNLADGFLTQQGVGAMNFSDMTLDQKNYMLHEQIMTLQNSTQTANGPVAQRFHGDGIPTNVGVIKASEKHAPLLEKSSTYGNRLRSYYSLALDTLFNLPPIPSDEEYCAKLNGNMTPSMLPPFDVAALKAARFAELALGALVSNQISLALELSSATVTSLKECVEEPIHPNCTYDVAKAYFLHGIFRSYRGDMTRYFKYRRVCLAKLSQLDSTVNGIQQLLAAISFHDSWAYMIYNANESELPDIDGIIPRVPGCGRSDLVSPAEQKYNVSTDHARIASDPQNQMWIQGPPPVFINNEAPPLSRSLDALACAIRSCCDQANTKFHGLSKQSGMHSDDLPTSATATAVTTNQNELCSRNMVLSAFVLLQQAESVKSDETNQGQHMLVSAMDAFLEGGDALEAGGFTDSQIQSLLSVCNTVIDNPLLLYQAGPTYHMASNAAILLCHLLNGLYATTNVSSGTNDGDMEAALFDEVLDTYISVRKILNSHRRKVPMILRCHGLPRPNLLGHGDNNIGRGHAFIDLGETQMCASRGCQGFVLMACSPCVAAERAQAAQASHQQEMNEGEPADFRDALSDELDIDDDALLSILGKIVNA